MIRSLVQLPPLEDIIETVNYVDPNETQDRNDIIETLQIFIHEILEKNPRMYELYNFDEELYECVYDTFMLCYEQETAIILKFDLCDVISEAMDLYFCMHKPRSYTNTFYPINANYKELEQHIEKNMKKEQPEQKTTEWYKFRHGMLTASSIWKCLSTDGNKNNLIYQKCLPSDKNSKRGVNVNSAMHWGHKYEPLSIKLYEEEHLTEVAEVGCVRHDTIPFLGASPDGINIKRNHPLYGRALEIKNPVSRELSGTPKFDYWVQMQLQMEVWNFEEVDFLETVFKEYDCEEDFEKDGNYNNTLDGKKKGVIVVFSGEKPVYEYMPFGLSKEEGETWIDNIIDTHSNLSWIQNVYWYLHDVSCVLVPRNKEWFNAALPCFREVWQTIERERINGYSHRAPKTRARKKVIVMKTVETQTLENQTIPAEKSQSILESGDTNIKVFRIRTESFDQAKAELEQ